MKKIAVIANGHTGSTLPLLIKLLLKGYSVDYYFIWTGDISQMEASDCVFSPSKIGINYISQNNYPKLAEYINDSKFRMFCINNIRPFKKVPIISSVYGIIRKEVIKKACKQIDDEQYDVINIIGRYNSSDIKDFIKFLSGKVIVSLHEVANHMQPNYKNPNGLIKHIVDNRNPIIVFSENSKKDILQYEGIDEKLVNHINFGLFETYKIYRRQHLMDLPDKYILFVGYITPYKGLPILYDALKKTDLKDYKIVIAGAGKDDVLEKMRKDDRYHIINRFLTNSELVELIERSTFLTCPYVSASQSGIPQTAFVFKKPIIASNIGGFQEIITNGEIGYLFETNNPIDLSEKINLLISNSQEILRLESNLCQFEKYHLDFSWDTIAEKYIKLIDSYV